MSYAWDCFCPGCSAAMVGGMGEGDENMQAEIKSYSGKAIYCSSCKILFDFDTMEEVDLADYDSVDIIEGG